MGDDRDTLQRRIDRWQTSGAPATQTATNALGTVIGAASSRSSRVSRACGRLDHDGARGGRRA